MIKNITLLLTVRGEERRGSVELLLKYLSFGMMVNNMGDCNLHKIIIEQDKQPHYSELAEYFSCQYVFARNTRGFNRSWGFNVGVKQCSIPTDIFICCDVDVISPSFWIPEIIDQMNRDGLEILLPFKDIYHINKEQISLDLMSYDPVIRNPILTIDEVSRNPAGWGLSRFTHDSSIGTVCAVTKDFYYKAQGHNEMYETWGCEDVDWAYKCQYLTGTHLTNIRSGHILFHMHHPTFKPDFQTSEFHRQNLVLTHKIWDLELQETLTKLKAGTLQPVWGELNRYGA